jgi:hypothetical protein
MPRIVNEKPIMSYADDDHGMEGKDAINWTKVDGKDRGSLVPNGIIQIIEAPINTVFNDYGEIAQTNTDLVEPHAN